MSELLWGGGAQGVVLREWSSDRAWGVHQMLPPTEVFSADTPLSELKTVGADINKKRPICYNSARG